MDDFAPDLPLRRFFFRWERALAAVLPGADWHALAAVSGGCDSVALARLLLESSRRGAGRLTLGHVNHGLRPGADEDENRVRELAAGWGVELLVAHVDARARAAEHGWSIEQAARVVRFEALARLARECGAGAILLGHQMDDQAETVLLRLLRGTGPRGLGGMRPRRRLRDDASAPPLLLLRPLLGFRRDELRVFAARAGLVWSEDASNRDPGPLRNRIRAELIPRLERAYNPRLVESLAATADRQRLESGLIARAAGRAWQRVRRDAQPPAVALDAVALAREPTAIATHVLWRAYQTLAGPHAALGSRHARALLAAARRAAGGEPASVHLPGSVRARCTRERIVLEPHRPRPPRQESA